MNKRISTLFLGLILMASAAVAQTARVQVIHNSADLAADTVDVWLNDALLLDNFAFRDASPFVDAPAGVSFDVTIQPKTSTDTTNGLWRKSYTLASGDTYILVANGIVSPDGYDPAEAFDIYVYGMGREAANTSGKTDVLVFHGSTDAPAVDVVEVAVPAGTIVDNASYGDFAGYLELDPAAYSLQIRTQDQTTVAQYAADLSSLGNAALTVVASGFLNPANNSQGPAFGLYVATATGGPMIMLPTEDISTARVQVIHNSADAAAASVDVYLDDARILDDFAFRTASPFIDAPAGSSFDITIAPSSSADSSDGIWRKSYTLAGGSKYILIANGIVSATGYDPATAFDIYVYDMARESSMEDAKTDVLVFHGSTDAPTVNVAEVAVPAGIIVEGASYGDFAGYLALDPAAYSLQIQTTDGTAVAQYGADISGFADESITVIASGFLNPDNNSAGPAFGLFVATYVGGALLELPSESITPARVQVIHNSADMAADTVDVWLDNTLLLDDFAFRTASPFVDAPAGTMFDIRIAGKNSTDTTSYVWKKSYKLMSNHTYILVANGIVSGTGYDPAEAFDIYVYDMGREAAMESGKTDVVVFHGSTDAPTVNVVETKVPAGTIISDLAYGAFEGYLSLDPMAYMLEIQTTDGTPVVQYDTDLSTLGGAAITVVASGFLNPANNSDGAAFGLFVATAAGGDLLELPAVPFPARVQVIHNSADMAADTVDVWLDNTLLLDNFAFRNASPFVDAPAGVDFDIRIAGKNSTDTTSYVWKKTYKLESQETYILVANGIVSGSGYDPAEAFDIYVYAMGREMAEMAGKADVLVFHGSTDAPTVDVVEVKVPAGTIVEDLMYGAFDGYLSLDPMAYSLQIQTTDGTPVVQYGADLSGLGDAAITVVASGFLNPANNSDGPAFGLFVATAAGGELLALPSEDLTLPMARVQVIHNSADAAAAMVDVYLDDALLLDDFAFRTASPFIDAPAGSAFDITIAPSSSSDSSDGIWRKSYTLMEDETYILVANGIVSASGYDPSTAFDIDVYGMGREAADMSGKTDVLVYHGSTDAPTVDVVEVKVPAGTIVDDISYSEFQGYLSLDPMAYSLQIQTTDGMPVAQFGADLSTLADAAITVLASGFLNPANNSDGAAFGLFVATATGGALLELPAEEIPAPTARVQVIHNSADAAAAMVDVYLDDALLLDDFKFRTASPFIDAPAGTAFDITIAPSSSSDSSEGIWRKSYTLMEDETYVLIANGIVSGSGYDPVKAFDIHVSAMGREEASTMGNTDLYVFHGSTDAPVVDIYESTAGSLIDNLAYGEYADDYLELPTADYTIEVRDETGTTIVAAYQAPLKTLGLDDAAIVAVASGFLTPANNSDGAAFGIYVALAAGGDLVELPAAPATSSRDLIENRIEVTAFPNPVRDYLNLAFSIENASEVDLEIISITGQTMLRKQLGIRSAGEHTETLNMDSFQDGIYMLKLNTGDSIHTSRIKVVK